MLSQQRPALFGRPAPNAVTSARPKRSPVLKPLAVAHRKLLKREAVSRVVAHVRIVNNATAYGTVQSLLAACAYFVRCAHRSNGPRSTGYRSAVVG